MRAISNPFRDCRQAKPGQEMQANSYPFKGTSGAFKSAMGERFILERKP